LQHSDPRVIFADATHLGSIDEIRNDLPGVRAVVAMDDSSGFGATSLTEFTAGVEIAPPTEPAETDPCLVMYTGGTTGRPKAVLHNHRALVLTLHRTHHLWHVASPDARLYQCSPMFHVMGIPPGFCVPAGGGLSVLRAQMNIARMLTDIEAHQITHFSAVPTVLGLLLDHPDFMPSRLSSVRWVAYGGAMMPRQLLQRFVDVLPHVNFVQSYGMTEAFGSLTELSPDDHRKGHKLNSVGRPLLGVQLTVRDEQDEPCPAGIVGEICARAGTMLVEYRGDPERTERALRGGWYHTGDLGYVDDSGYFYVTDRVDDMIVTGGENVYSSEVEAALNDHPDVAQAAVVGIPHPVWGQAIHAVVVTKEGSSPSVAQIRAHVRERIADYKVPKTFDLRDEPLPLSAVGKVQKNVLREAAAVHAKSGREESDDTDNSAARRSSRAD
jgi:acyl-CoA synthetase (AMP-forming)/AMP-acid ligase II